MCKKILMVALGLLAAAAHSMIEDGVSAESISKILPKSYAGIYKWVGSGESWNASVAFSKVEALKDGTVQAVGTEHFVSKAEPDKTYDSGVRATIHPQTLSFEMEEIYTGNDKDFLPMVYKGKISRDLKSIDSEWTGPQGEKVKLTLQAAGSKKE